MQDQTKSQSRSYPLLAAAVAVLALLGACTDSSTQETSTEGSTGAPTTTVPILILSAEDVGPSAFTPPVDTAPLNGAPTGACDKQALINELSVRPEARREWAAVLSVPEDQVDAYINTLEPGILGSDTRMTNHGLGDDGKAFAIQATLTAGTAVLVDTSEGTQNPVTRCKCGNPLLPPITPPEATTTTPNNDSTTTTYYDTTTTYYDTSTTYYYDETTTTYYDEFTTTTEYYPTASEVPYTEPEPEDYETIPPTLP